MQEIQLDGKSRDITKDNIEKLRQIFPEIFNEDKIDFEKLKVVLGEDIDKQDEKYHFTWRGKMNALRLSQTPSVGTLRPCKEESKNWDTTQNIYIEGDNLEVLKLLQNSYLNSIKMIYIDPPYNTGKDRIYKDDYKDNIKNYKIITGQIDGEGNITTTNKDTDGRYHTNWLNMMYPRLRIARNLLTDDGVIFISIDEHEVRNLKNICDEIFDEKNFIADIIRKTKSTTEDIKSGLNVQHEYLCVYAKNINKAILHGNEKTFESYKNPDNDPNGLWCSADPSARSGGESTYFPIKNPYTGIEDYPPKGRYWAFSQSTMNQYIKTGKIKFRKSYKENERGFTFKRYKKDVQDLYNSLDSLFAIDNEFMNQAATKELQEFFSDLPFEYPKPTAYIEKLVHGCAGENDVILDFFSGSATTAHACMRLNSKDDGNRKFIMVQWPEKTGEKSEAYKAGFENICEIGKERIRRAGEKIKEEIENANQQLKSEEELKKIPDIGFKVFKLDSSNIRKWNPDTEDLEKSLLNQVDNFIDGRSEEDALYEIILKCGFELTVPVKELNIEGKKVYSVNSGALIVCLDNDITLDVACEIAKIITQFEDKKGVTVVFKDNGFKDDSVKTNVKETIRAFGVGKFMTV